MISSLVCNFCLCEIAALFAQTCFLLRSVISAHGAPLQVQDYGDVVIHVFEPAQREYYDLEGFYGAAEEVRQACFLLHVDRLAAFTELRAMVRRDWSQVTGTQLLHNGIK